MTEKRLARFWHPLETGGVQCDLCPRGCKLKDGQRGFCFIRVCKGDTLVAAAYGRSTGFCLDPIEKKPLYHFLPGTATLSFGTIGCNLACSFCQNWQHSRTCHFETLCIEAAPDKIAKAAKRLGCSSVSYTYNDPTISAEHAIDTAQACSQLGIKNIAVTAGYITKTARTEFMAAFQAANVDLKGFTDDFYSRNCQAHLQPVLDTLVYIKDHTEVWLELTVLLIPGENDSDHEIDALTKWVAANLGREVPLHFTGFHPDYLMGDKGRTSPQTLSRARAIAAANGLRFVYTGNLVDIEGGSTYCPGCGKQIIVRRGFEVDQYRLDASGACSHCAAPIPGIFGPGLGTWRGGRQAVDLEHLSTE